jgi:hypothetical protein
MQPWGPGCQTCLRGITRHRVTINERGGRRMVLGTAWGLRGNLRAMQPDEVPTSARGRAAGGGEVGIGRSEREPGQNSRGASLGAGERLPHEATLSGPMSRL